MPSESYSRGHSSLSVESTGVAGSIEWYASDTTDTIEYLRRKIVDVGITYHAIAECTALDEGVIDRVEYAWRDHWILVGIRAHYAPH